MQRTERIVPISIAMTKSMARRIRVLAAQRDQSRSEFVRDVLKPVLEDTNSVPVHRIFEL